MTHVACVALIRAKDSNRRHECGHTFHTNASNVPCPACGTRARTVPWPTRDQLEQAGFTRCQHDGGCGVYLDAMNLTDAEKPDGHVLCIAHRRTVAREQQHRRRDQQDDRRAPRVPYIPRDARPTRRDRIADRDRAGTRR